MPARKTKHKYVHIQFDPYHFGTVRIPGALDSEHLGHIEVHPWGINWVPKRKNRYARGRTGEGFTWKELDELTRLRELYGSAGRLVDELKARMRR